MRASRPKRARCRRPRTRSTAGSRPSPWIPPAVQRFSVPVRLPAAYGRQAGRQARSRKQKARTRAGPEQGRLCGHAQRIELLNGRPVPTLMRHRWFHRVRVARQSSAPRAYRERAAIGALVAGPRRIASPASEKEVRLAHPRLARAYHALGSHAEHDRLGVPSFVDAMLKATRP